MQLVDLQVTVMGLAQPSHQTKKICTERVYRLPADDFLSEIVNKILTSAILAVIFSLAKLQKFV